MLKVLTGDDNSEDDTMLHCCHCGGPVETDDVLCPHCHRPRVEGAVPSAGHEGLPTANDVEMPDSHDVRLLPIARFTNAAEAGYFAHELTRGENIPATVTVSESFDALSGYWSTRYVLTVPEPLAETATIHLRELIEQSGPEEAPLETEFDYDSRSFAGSENFQADRPFETSDMTIEKSGVNWVPIVLTLAAGSVVFWGVRTMDAKPKVEAAAGRQADLWQRLATPKNPWVQQSENGGGRRELWIDAGRREGFLLEDRDGDGEFETKIPIGGLVPDR